MYTPVDVSETFLKLASSYAEQHGFSVTPIRASFEELPEILPKTQVPRFVSLGLTYSNYEPREILRLLKEIAGENGFIFINSQIRERTDLERPTNSYQNETSPIIAAKLPLIDLNIETDVENIQTDDRVQIWCALKNTTPELQKRGLKGGDKILLFQSFRPSLEKFRADLEESGFKDFTLFDTGDTFVAAVLKS